MAEENIEIDLIHSVRLLIREHIENFLKEPTHYSGNNSEKLCLSTDLNLSKIYSLYIELNPEIKVSKTL